MEIVKVRNDHVIDFAAEELKKYLRMMMPQKGDIHIYADPNGTAGFRLGLLSDFGIEFEGQDPYFDDVVHIDADADGGILAGSNPRSVLFAVYRFLKCNGCRFYFPGPEGEHIPCREVEKTVYHKMADHRLRGHTLEGEPSLEQVLDYIDFHAKEELNAFGLYCISVYQRRYYIHRFNDMNRPTEPFNGNVADTQWRALYESECKKRGFLLFSGEHDLIPEALGLDVADRELYRTGQKKIPLELYTYFAQLNGKRDLYKNDILFTNLCYSNPQVRTMIARQAVRQAMAKPYLDYLGVTFADGYKNHCECEECTKKRPSDWYVMLLNEIDEKLTEAGSPMKILFSYYVDCKFAPTVEKIRNPDRFMFQYCPTSRAYTSSINENSVIPEPLEFKHNAWENTKTAEEDYALLRQWKNVFPGPCSVFEYHFWRSQYRDPGSVVLARRVYEDTLSHKFMGTCGCMQDGSNKSFWPNGFAGHIYAQTLMDRSVDYECELEDYYSNLYGDDWKGVLGYLTKISEAFDFPYMQGKRSADEARGTHYNPERADYLSCVKEFAAEIRALEKKQTYRLSRCQWIAWRLLLRHADYCEGLADVMIEKCQGRDLRSLEMLMAFFEEFGKREIETERYFDFGLAVMGILPLVKRMPKVEF